MLAKSTIEKIDQCVECDRLIAVGVVANRFESLLDFFAFHAALFCAATNARMLAGIIPNPGIGGIIGNDVE